MAAALVPMPDVGWLLPSIDAKLKRAEYHLRKLDEVAASGAVTDLITTRTDRDRHGRVRIRVEAIDEMPPEWSVWIGECVHDMRTALDHLAYGLNIIGSRKDPPPNHSDSAFPTCPNRRAYRTSKNVRKAIAYFPPGARTRIERVQPYHGRKNDPWGARRLSDLARLSNIDKHRRFPITAHAVKQMAIPAAVDGHPVTHYTTQYRLLKLDTTILWLEAPALPPSVKQPNVQLNLGTTIEFEGVAANPPIGLLVPHEPVTFTLDAILTYIRELVLPEFAPFIPAD